MSNMFESEDMTTWPVTPLPTRAEYLSKSGAARASAANKRRSAQASRDIAAHPDCDRAFRPGHLKAAEDLETGALVDLAFAEKCEQWALEVA